MKTAIIALITNNAMTTKEVAAQLGVTLQKVTGQMAVLKKDENFKFEDGKMIYVVPVVEEPKKRAPKENAKSTKARDVFIRMNKGEGVARKDILAAFQIECGLTKNGASTYLQNLKREFGLIRSKD